MTGNRMTPIRRFVLWMLTAGAPGALIISIDAVQHAFTGRYWTGSAIPVTAAALYDSIGRYPEALAWLDRVPDRSDGMREISDWVAALRKNLALRQFLGGDFQSALDTYDLLDLEGRLDYIGGIYRGIALMKVGRMDEAFGEFESQSMKYPDRQDAFVAMGHFKLARGEDTAATDLFKEAIARAPNLGIVRVDIGDGYWERGDRGMALEWYHRAEACDPWEIQVILRMIRAALETRSDSDSLTRWMDTARSTNPGHPIVEKLVAGASHGNPVWTEQIEAMLMTPCTLGDNRSGMPSKILFLYLRDAWRGCGS